MAPVWFWNNIKITHKLDWNYGVADQLKYVSHTKKKILPLIKLFSFERRIEYVSLIDNYSAY